MPPDPVDTTRDLPKMWRSAALAALTLVGITALAGAGLRR
jgi:formate dehydrogenase iron-sulfur subunit